MVGVGRAAGSEWLQWGGVERGGDGVKKTDQTLGNRRYTGLYPKSSKLILKIGPESRCSLSRCSGMELHHPIMSKLGTLEAGPKERKNITS